MITANPVALTNTTLRWREETYPCPCHGHLLGGGKKSHRVPVVKPLSTWFAHSPLCSRGFLWPTHVTLITWGRGKGGHPSSRDLLCSYIWCQPVLGTRRAAERKSEQEPLPSESLQSRDQRTDPDALKIIPLGSCRWAIEFVNLTVPWVCFLPILYTAQETKGWLMFPKYFLGLWAPTEGPAVVSPMRFIRLQIKWQLVAPEEHSWWLEPTWAPRDRGSALTLDPCRLYSSFGHRQHM